MLIERGYGDSGVDAALGMLAADGRVLVRGPAGSGRTSLLAAVAAHDGARRRVWWCRGHRSGGPSGEPTLHDGAVDDVVTAAGHERTTLLVDDADLLSAGVLERVLALVERRHALDLRVALGHRPVAATAALAAVDEALIGPHGALHLGPLGVGGVAAWLAERGTELDPVDIVARTGGWPELVAVAIRSPGAAADLFASRLAMLAPGQQRVIRAVCFGLPVGGAAMAVACGVPAADVDDAVLRAAAVGLIHDGAEPRPLVAEAVRAGTPPADRAAIAAAATSAPTDVLVAVARHLLAAGDRCAEAGRVYELAGDAVHEDSPELATRLYDEALRAGRPPAGLHGRRATAALAEGRVEEAMALAGTALVEGSGDDPRAHRAAGAAWSHLGRPDLAADCYRAAGDNPLLAVAPLLAAGRLDDARDVVESTPATDRDPARVFASGVLAFAAGEVDRALVLLERSARMVDALGGGADWPDTPHAVAALVASDWLDAERAGSLAGRASDGAVGGAPFATRHRLIEAWAALRAGRLDEAAAGAGAGGAGRDALLAVTIRAALAMRGDDHEELPAIHRDAVVAAGACQPDPFAASPTVELAHLAARVGGDPAVILGPLEALADQLGDPPTMRVHLAWARVLVAISSDDASGARHAATQLQALAGLPPIAADATAAGTTRLLADAAAAFADVLAGEVDAGAVRAMAARLVDRGLVFEASRLVGGAGVRSSDPKAARGLLGDLRRLRATQVRDGGSSAVGPRPVVDLSEREREVARAVLEGLTHREIGAQLYISAKTVEHHVARIRQKLGAGSRAELLAAIRAELARIH